MTEAKKYYDNKAIIMAFYKALKVRQKYGDASIEIMLRYLEEGMANQE